uniref:Rab effector Noc2 n=1 Tax=Falco tinnunculus TaxID=100819 RepID=A0A8C4VC39_FALTI
MADMIFGSGTGQWVCPNDRQLALRAKLQTGWSVHTFQTEKQRKMQALSPQELEVILEVIRKAEKLDIIEQQRIGRLVERLENMRKNAMGNGLSQCLLCGELLGLLGSTSVFCQDCKKKVCTKCGIETFGAQKRPLWLCKICSEQREWFLATVRATRSSVPPAWMTSPYLQGQKPHRAESAEQNWANGASTPEHSVDRGEDGAALPGSNARPLPTPIDLTPDDAASGDFMMLALAQALATQWHLGKYLPVLSASLTGVMVCFPFLLTDTHFGVLLREGCHVVQCCHGVQTCVCLKEHMRCSLELKKCVPHLLFLVCQAQPWVQLLALQSWLCSLQEKGKFTRVSLKRVVKIQQPFYCFSAQG